MKNLFIGLLLCGFTTPVFTQIIELEEVVIYPSSYKYLFEVSDENPDEKVKTLQKEIAKFDVTKDEYYSDDYDNYIVSFYIAQGYAVATYDKDGKLLRTIERYKNVRLPLAVSEALAKRFSQWTVDKDIYRVAYSDRKWEAKKVYKLKLTNLDQTIRVKVDEYGNFL